MDIFDQNCPLCDSPAKFKHAARNNRRHFTCPKCTSFQISKFAAQELLNHSQEWRDDLSKRAARAPEGYTLVIILPSSSKEEKTSKVFDVHYVQDDKLPD